MESKSHKIVQIDNGFALQTHYGYTLFKSSSLKEVHDYRARHCPGDLDLKNEASPFTAKSPRSGPASNQNKALSYQKRGR